MPEIFFLHDNSSIAFVQNETTRVLTNLISLQSTSAKNNTQNEDLIITIINDILSRLPERFSLPKLSVKYPIVYEQSMNTVLIQELTKYNRLMNLMEVNLRDLLKSLKGILLMSESLEMIAQALYNNQVPGAWMAKSYPSLMPLSHWFNDLLARVEFMKIWCDEGKFIYSEEN